MNNSLIFRQLFDQNTGTYTYILADADSKEAIIIDPVSEHTDRDLQVLSELGLKLVYILDTHIHADHITAAGVLREKTGAKIVLHSDSTDPKPDINIAEGETLRFGKYEVQAMETPGHTNACTSFLVEDMIFTGDALLIRKTGRTDFQEGSPDKLFDSITKIYTLPDKTKIFPGHDYTGLTMSTVGEEKKYNTRIRENTTREEFVATMHALKLPNPKFIDIALPRNKCLGLEAQK